MNKFKKKIIKLLGGYTEIPIQEPKPEPPKIITQYVETIGADYNIDIFEAMKMEEYHGNHFEEYIKDQLTCTLSNELLKYIKVETYDDPTNIRHYTTKIKIVKEVIRDEY